MQAASGPSIDLTQGGSEDEDEVPELVCFGKFRTKVVGTRYYDGMANIDEMVLLDREPHNPYDNCAIRVDNVYHEKIGHIGKDQAGTLSMLIDSGILRIEGIVQGKKGAYSMPLDVYCFGLASDEAAVVRRLSRGGIQLLEHDTVVGGGGGGGGRGRASQASPSSTPRGSGSGAVIQQHRLERLFEDLQEGAGVQSMMDAAEAVTSPLFPHQQVALAWMVNRENCSQLPPFWEPKIVDNHLLYENTLTNFCVKRRPEPLRGGILADDMGLGKTLVVISLIATNAPGAVLPPTHTPPAVATPAAAGSRIAEDDGAGPSSQRPKKKQKTSTPAPATPASPQNSQLLASLSKSTQGKKAAAANAAAARAVEMDAAATPPTKPPAASGPRTTLIVCPLSVLSNWSTQLEEHTTGNLKVYMYHGPARNRSHAFLAAHDVVITTYATLAGEPEAKSRNGLQAVSWLRVVLDEAHTIKNVATQQAKAAASLQAERRWEVTGTPIQNNLKDLFGLLTFLRLPPLSERSIFTRVMERPVKQNDPRGYMALKVLMRAVAMRRDKTMLVNGKPIVQLPDKTIHIVKVPLAKADQSKYSRLELEGRRLISRHLQENTLMDNYLSVLEIILRLRQVCDAGILCPHEGMPAMSAPTSVNANAAALSQELSSTLTLLQASGEDECSVCLCTYTAPCITSCRHIFCRLCIETVLSGQRKPCPLCRHVLTDGDLIDPAPPAPDAAVDGGEDASASATAKATAAEQGAKVAALLAKLQSNAVADNPARSVVFSQFTGMLDLVQSALKDAGIPFCRLDGSTPAKRRGEMVAAFARQAPGAPSVFLISLKAGGVGINLTAASEVHLLDPWWNACVEDQAMDRVHRMGQVRDVHVYRYIAQDTIEERMLALQERKRELAGAAFDRRSPHTMRQMRTEDIKLLMQL